jgi:hypothetical protein
MNPTEIFIDAGRLRPAWRFFLSLALLFSALVLSSETVGLAFHLLKVHPQMYAAFFWGSLLALPAILGTFKLMTAVFERRPLGSQGLAFHSRWWRELGRGLAVGAATLLLVVGLEWGCGFAHFSFMSHPGFGTGAVCFALFAVAAVNEESIFRGYPFQRLVESITPLGAVALSSALFGLVHLGNPHRTGISTLNTALVGIAFAIAYLRTRSLWMPIGMHFIWNFLMGFFLGLPVSGLVLPGTLLTTRVQGPFWLTGGSYGPEGGLMATGGIVALTVYVSAAKSIYTSEEMKALVFAPVSPSGWPESPITIFPAAPEEQAKRD